MIYHSVLINTANLPFVILYDSTLFKYKMAMSCIKMCKMLTIGVFPVRCDNWLFARFMYFWKKNALFQSYRLIGIGCHSMQAIDARHVSDYIAILSQSRSSVLAKFYRDPAHDHSLLD